MEKLMRYQIMRMIKEMVQVLFSLNLGRNMFLSN